MIWKRYGYSQSILPATTGRPLRDLSMAAGATIPSNALLKVLVTPYADSSCPSQTLGKALQARRLSCNKEKMGSNYPPRKAGVRCGTSNPIARQIDVRLPAAGTDPKACTTRRFKGDRQRKFVGRQRKIYTFAHKLGNIILTVQALRGRALRGAPDMQGHQRLYYKKVK